MTTNLQTEVEVKTESAKKSKLQNKLLSLKALQSVVDVQAEGQLNRECLKTFNKHQPSSRAEA